MEDMENEQRSYGDRFWGYDVEIDNRDIERGKMAIEEQISTDFETQNRIVEKHLRWDQEVKENAYADSFIRALEQVQERRRYLKTVFSTDTSQHIMDYKWSTRVKVKPSFASDGTGGIVSMHPRVHSRNVSPVLRKSTDDFIHMPNYASGQQHLRHQIEQSSQPISAETLESENCVNLASNRIYPTSNSGLSSSKDTERVRFFDNRDIRSNEHVLGRFVDGYDGHPEFKWDQAITLKKSFLQLCQMSASNLHSSSTAQVLCIPHHDHLGILISALPEVRMMLRYTVFGSWVKRKKWHLFITKSPNNAVDYPSDTFLTLADWLSIAHESASREFHVVRRLIRTADHCRLSTANSDNRWCDRLQRAASSARKIVKGSMVWALHGRGAVWLPAVVEAVHICKYPLREQDEGDIFSYDLSYIMTQQEFATAFDEHNALVQPNRTSAMSSSSSELRSIDGLSRPQNQEDSDERHCKRASTATSSALPEEAMARHVYDAYHNCNSSSHVDTHTDYTFQSTDASVTANSHRRLEALFVSLLSSDLLDSSESLLCVCRTPTSSTGSYGVHTSPCNSTARRGVCGGMWKHFLSDLLASKDSKPDTDPSVVSSVPQHGIKRYSGILLEEWMETCSAAMDIELFNSYQS